MKKILLPFFLFQLFSFFSIGQTNLSGKITAVDTSEELIGANVILKMKGVFVAGVSTDFNGNYSLFVDPGTYDVKISFLGYPASLIRGVIVKPGQSNKLDTQMTNPEGVLLDEIVVTEYKLPLIEVDNTTQCCLATSEVIRKLPTRNTSALASNEAKTSQVDATSVITVRSCRSNPSDYYFDGIRVRRVETISVEKKEALENQIDESKIVDPNKEPTLTAGEWNGLEDWEYWESLLAEKNNKHQQIWQLFPSQGFSVEVVNQAGFALSGCVVKLVDNVKNIIWQTKTDNRGKAVLWSNLFGESSSGLKIIAEYETTVSKAQKALPFGKINKFQLPINCKNINNVDIAFVVDATGSMRDEIKFLKTELRDVIDQVAENSEGLNIQTSSIFFRDQNDEYVTRSSSFTNNPSETIAFIDKQTATGGGDDIEAVDVALEVALKMNWRENAVARILFLIMDAPPSTKPEVLKNLHDQIRKAAELGVQIIPIAASEVNQSTEFLMKSMAIVTNGTYVFLTDHSGVGNPHLEATVSNYNVENLNELMVRLLSEFSDQIDCDTPKQSRKAEIAEKVDQSSTQSRYFNQPFYFYPNPADDQVFIVLKESFGSIRLVNVTGKILRTINYPEANINRMDLSDLPAGIYFLQFQKGAEVITRRLMIAKS